MMATPQQIINAATGQPRRGRPTREETEDTYYASRRRDFAMKVLLLLEDAQNVAVRVGCGAERHDQVLAALRDVHHALVFKFNPLAKRYP